MSKTSNTKNVEVFHQVRRIHKGCWQICAVALALLLFCTFLQLWLWCTLFLIVSQPSNRIFLQLWLWCFFSTFFCNSDCSGCYSLSSPRLALACRAPAPFLPSLVLSQALVHQNLRSQLLHPSLSTRHLTTTGARLRSKKTSSGGPIIHSCCFCCAVFSLLYFLLPVQLTKYTHGVVVIDERRRLII